MCDSVAAKHLATFPNGLRPADQARVQELAPLGDGRAVFTVSYDERFGCEPWISDGTVTGTAVAVDLNPGPASSDPGEFVLSKGAVLFVADPDGGSDRRLHTMSVGATARYHGPGAAASGYVARLHCTDPIRGGKMDLVLSDAPASSAGLLLIGRPKWPATKLGAGAWTRGPPQHRDCGEALMAREVLVTQGGL